MFISDLVAALLVSMGQHTLDNDVILSATHDLSLTKDDQIPRDTFDDLIIEEAPKSRTIGEKVFNIKQVL